MASFDRSLRCQLITDFSILESFACEWERLFVSTAPPGGIFQSWAWTKACWNASGARLSLATPVLFDDGRIVAILPVAVENRTARFIGAPYADYNGMLCEPDYASRAVPALIGALLEAPAPWKHLCLEQVPETSPLLSVDATSAPAWFRSRWQVTFGYSCPTAVSTDGKLFETLGRKESLRRHEKRLARRGVVAFRHVEDRDEILAVHLDRFIDMQVTRQALKGGRSRLLGPEGRATLENLITELRPERELRFSVLEMDGAPIAYHLGFEHAGRYLWYMPAFDLELWNEGPGEVLLKNVLKYAHEKQLTELDFTIGDEEYKNRFATTARRTFDVHVDRRPYTPAVQLRRMVRSAGDAIRRRPERRMQARRVLAFVRHLAARTDLRKLRIRSAVDAFLSLFRARAGVICHGVRRVAPPEGVQLTTLTLTDLARLRLEHPSLDDATVQSMRRRMKDNTGYIASVGSTRHVFWMKPLVDEGTGNERPHMPKACIVVGPSVGEPSSSTLTDGLASLLCAVRPQGDEWDVFVRSVDLRAVESAAQQAGYLPVQRDRCTGLCDEWSSDGHAGCNATASRCFKARR